jgi:hypothetical protein
MTPRATFDILLLIARPAAGKSEIIHYLKGLPPAERAARFHIGEFEEIDDFPLLWAWFEEDQLLEQMGHARLHTDSEGFFIGHHLWDLLIERICLEYEKKVRGNLTYHDQKTTILEFARGSEHGGFGGAFQHLSPAVLSRLAILYIDVSWEESLRKNRRRFNPERPHSILEHGLADDKMERLYRESDWQQISAAHPEVIQIQGVQVPYAVFENEVDLTSQGGEALGLRLSQALDTLYRRFTRFSPCRAGGLPRERV